MQTIAQARVVRSVNMPAGTYFLGDPVQALGCDDYDRVVEESNDFSRARIRHGDLKLLVFRTRSGALTLNDELGEDYRVESGVIGLVPTALATARPAPELAKVGRIVRFREPVQCTRRSDGVLTFGEYRINTRS